MKLVINEYLSMLKEDGEIDAIISDLSICMDLVPLTNIEKGKQYGVDLISIGLDKDDCNQKKAFMFLIKRGDITRNNWNSDKNSVRQSIEEIIDSGEKISLDPEFKDLKKKIVVCTNGDLSQNLLAQWNGFKENLLKKTDFELEFWGSDKLSILVEEYLFNEYSIIKNDYAKKSMRKTLAFLDLNDYEPNEFYNLIQKILFEDIAKEKKDIIKSFKLLNLCLSMIFHWSKESGNLKVALLSSERLILKVWEYIYINDFYNDKKINDNLNLIISTHLRIVSSYLKKIENHCYIKDGLVNNTEIDGFEYQLITFEQIGIISSIGLFFVFLSIISDNDEYKKLTHERALIASDILESLIMNNRSSFSPLFDGHIIDISTALLLLFYSEKYKIIDLWIDNLFRYILTGYQIFKFFPIFSDDYEELVDSKFLQDDDKQKDNSINGEKKIPSTLVYILLEWLVVLKKEDRYNYILESIESVLPNLSLQIWYPDKDMENKFYSENILFNNGSTNTNIKPNKNFNRFKLDIIEESKKEDIHLNLSFIKYYMFSIGIIASRHYRTPLLPFYWRNLINESN